MPLENFSKRQVDNGIEDLKTCLTDLKRCGTLDEVQKLLPRFSYLFRNDTVLIEVFNQLPKPDTEHFLRAADENSLKDFYLELPVDPKERLSLQVAVLIAIGEHRAHIWNLAMEGLENSGENFWEDFFNPTIRDLLRYVSGIQETFAENQTRELPAMKSKSVTKKTYTLDLFISHCHEDKALAKALIELLQSALAIPHERIRCTSVDGYKLFAGAPTETELRREIHETKCLIGLITPSSIKSTFVLFELGARWGAGEHLVLLLGSGSKTSDLRPPISNLNVLNSASEADMQQVVHNIGKMLGKEIPLPATYKQPLTSLLRKAKVSALDEVLDEIVPFKI